MVKLGLLCFLGFCFSYSHAGCPLGEVYSNCAQPISCVTCENPQPCPTFTCSPGCNCPDGQLRGPGSECIPRDQCPSKRDKSECPVNEEMVSCVKPIWCNSCEVRGNCKLYSHFCQEGCDCKPKHFRNKYGFCVPEENCSGLDPF